MNRAPTSIGRPLFIVGMPRSGTKLLRAMLNQHSMIAIADVETEFFPYWVSQWSRYGDLSKYPDFERFFVRFTSYPFYRYMESRGEIVDPQAWYRACSGFSPSAVFEALIKLTAHFQAGQQRIWGDKSPSYLPHLELLRKHFPSARFIHIVRDVRDYCLSINRAWGKNILRAAQRWNDDVYRAHVIGASWPDDYLELRYEDLLADPVGVSRKMCEFLEVPFEPEIVELASSEENLGDAKGYERILQSNTRKYVAGLDLEKRHAIERIAVRTMKVFSYDCPADMLPKRLNRLQMALLKCMDGCNLLLASCKVRGLANSLRFLLRYSQITSKTNTPWK